MCGKARPAALTSVAVQRKNLGDCLQVSRDNASKLTISTASCDAYRASLQGRRQRLPEGLKIFNRKRPPGMRTKPNTLRQNRRASASMLTSGKLSYRCPSGS
jgi:hypothetical protein